MDFKKYRILISVVAIIIAMGTVMNNIDWFLKILFPIHYKDLIYENAIYYDIDPYLVAAIIKTESKFYEKAISSKNARGLMQIAPITGKWASEELHIENYTEELLFIPNINIRIGCWYLSVLRKEFDGNLQLMLAAYNGGSGNVSKWLKDPRYSKDGTKLHDIPFYETKNYVEKVMRNYSIYRFIYTENAAIQWSFIF